MKTPKIQMVIRAERRANGLCTYCNNEAVHGKSLCKTHQEQRILYAQNRRKQMKDNGICSKCEKRPIAVGKTKCQTCLDKQSHENKKRAKDREKSYLCKQGCGTVAQAGRKLCTVCIMKHLDAMQATAQSRISQGLCVHCGKYKNTGKLHCEGCYLKTTSYSHFKDKSHASELKTIFVQQYGRCPYTKKLLTLGLDTSLDHKIPQSKGGANTMENLQWVYEPINAMKNELTEKEFLKLVEMVYKNSSSILSISGL